MSKKTASFKDAALNTRRSTRIFLLLGLLSLASFIASLAYSGFQAPSPWAAKAGAFVTIFAILALQKAQAMVDVLRSDGQADGDDFHGAQEKYRESAEAHMSVATSLAILGAFIGVLGG